MGAKRWHSQDGRVGLRSPLEMGVVWPEFAPPGLKLLMLDQLPNPGCIGAQILPDHGCIGAQSLATEAGMSGGGQAAAAPEPTWAQAVKPEFQRLEARNINMWTQEDYAVRTRSLVLRWQLLIFVGRKSFWKHNAHFTAPSDLPGAADFPCSPGSCQINGGPVSLVRELTVGISRMDNLQFQAPVSSSIIYKEYNENLTHNAFLMPFEHNIHKIPF